jgi:hypothetical protein
VHISQWIAEELEILAPHVEDDLRTGALKMPKLIKMKVTRVASIPMDDQPVHTLPEHPFCQDMTCPCHEDQELIQEYIAEHLQTGHLTEKEAEQLYRGQQKEEK